MGSLGGTDRESARALPKSLARRIEQRFDQLVAQALEHHQGPPPPRPGVPSTACEQGRYGIEAMRQGLTALLADLQP